jgi:hypothetical protein
MLIDASVDDGGKTFADLIAAAKAVVFQLLALASHGKGRDLSRKVARHPTYESIF